MDELGCFCEWGLMIFTDCARAQKDRHRTPQTLALLSHLSSSLHVHCAQLQCLLRQNRSGFNVFTSVDEYDLSSNLRGDEQSDD